MTDRNDLPVKRWLQVLNNLETATKWHEADELDEAVGYLIDAFGALYRLLEPSSVQKIRQEGTQAKSDSVYDEAPPP